MFRPRASALSFPPLLVFPIVLLKLTHQQVPNHLARGDDSRGPHGRQVEGAGDGVAEAEEHHGRDPAARVLEGEAVLGDLVALDVAADQVVDAARRVDLGRVLARLVGPLLARQDVKVVVGRVSSRVALGADGRAKNDQILGYACVKKTRLAKLVAGKCRKLGIGGMGGSAVMHFNTD